MTAVAAHISRALPSKRSLHGDTNYGTYRVRFLHLSDDKKPAHRPATDDAVNRAVRMVGNGKKAREAWIACGWPNGEKATSGLAPRGSSPANTNASVCNGPTTPSSHSSDIPEVWVAGVTARRREETEFVQTRLLPVRCPSPTPTSDGTHFGDSGLNFWQACSKKGWKRRPDTFGAARQAFGRY